MDDILIMTIALIYTFPLAAIGVIFIVEKWIMPRIKTRRGNVLISRVMASGHIKDFWVKPKQETTEYEEIVRDEKGDAVIDKYDYNPVTKEPIPIPETRTIAHVGYFFDFGKGEHKEKLAFYDNPDMVYFNGPVKRAFYDTEGSQLSINNAKKYAPPVNPKMLDSILTRVWNAARASVFMDKRNLQLLLMVAIAAAAMAVFTNMLLMGQVDEMSKTINAMSGTVNTLKASVESMRTAAAQIPANAVPASSIAGG